MKLILFGATGMVGAGVLREAVAAPEVEAVLCIGRRPSGLSHPKVRDLVLEDLFEFTAHETELVGWDACIWAVGISSIGVEEAAYARVTEELPLLWARGLLQLNPDSSFCYCSAAGAGGGSMWARVRQRVEKGVSTLPFRHVGVVRPAYIRPGPGIWSQVKLYNVGIALMSPIAPLLVRAFPFACTSSERLGRAMLRVVSGRADRFILESSDINRLGT
ncbi:MAG: hypothetical protein RJA70_1591 [Pseudomonadota bacterium]|jgi:uncharacterized protein YbjT (DUF2867 family)